MSSEEPIRLSRTSYAVLGLIGYLEPCTPYDLKRFIERSLANFWAVPHTTFYVEPARLAEAGYLTEEQEPSGRHRKLYSLTSEGRSVLTDWVNTPTAAPLEVRDEMVLKVFLGADPAPMIEQRLEWHRQKLAELEGYLEVVRQGDWPPGVERALLAGTTYHRALIQARSAREDQGRQGRPSN